MPQNPVFQTLRIAQLIHEQLKTVLKKRCSLICVNATHRQKTSHFKLCSQFNPNLSNNDIINTLLKVD